MPSDGDASDTETPQRDGYTVATYEGDFERMKDDPNIQVTDYSGMGSMSEFDVFVSYSVNAEIELPDLEQFADWLNSKQEDASKEYRGSAPRSENPRQTDIALGRSRAYKTAYRGFLDWWNEVTGEYDG
jgi:hypothetical protein